MSATRTRTAHRQATEPRSTPDRALRSTFATNIALALLAVVTGISAARLLHPSGEGELAAIQSWPLLLGTLAMLGFDSALVYFISRQPERGRQFTSTAVLLGLASCLAVGGVAWFVLPYLLSAQQPQVVSAARVFLLIGVIFTVISLPHGTMRGTNNFAAWNIFRVVPGLSWLAVLFVSWLLGHPSAIPLSRWYLAVSLVCCLPVLVVVNRRLQGPWRPDFKLAPKMLRFGLPTALTSVPQTINLRFDQLLIIAFLPARTLGLYVVAVSWSGAVAPLLSALGSVLFPHVSAERDIERQGHLLGRALQSGTVVAVATSVPFMLLAPVGLPLIFGSSFAPSIPSAIVLVPAGAILAWAGIAEEGLRGLGRPSVVLLAEITAAVVTLASLPVLLHFDGILGAAIASLLGYSTIAIFAVTAISHSTRQGIRVLVIPSWQVARSLGVRSVCMCRERRRFAGRHRSFGSHRFNGRHRLGGVD
jgi:O-antigen/teichoic acid export membrane protein